MSEKRNGILAGGNFITDYVKIIDAWPQQDTLTSIQSESMSNGGGPYNILKNLRCLDPELTLEACGLLGDDLNGRWIVQDCESAEIDVTRLQITTKAATSYTDAMTDSSTGRRTFFHQRGANALLGPEHFDFVGTQCKVFFLGYLMLLDRLDEIESETDLTGSARVLQIAKQAGLITAVDCVSTPSPNFRQVVLSAMREADVLFINEFEIGQVLGSEVGVERSDLINAATELQKTTDYAGSIVAHSVKGAVSVRDDHICSQAAIDFPGENVIGTSGAGDAFASGYLLGLHNHQSIQQCLLNGVCAAAQSLTDATPSGGMASMSDCLSLAETHGFRKFE